MVEKYRNESEPNYGSTKKGWEALVKGTTNIKVFLTCQFCMQCFGYYLSIGDILYSSLKHTAIPFFTFLTTFPLTSIRAFWVFISLNLSSGKIRSTVISDPNCTLSVVWNNAPPAHISMVCSCHNPSLGFPFMDNCPARFSENLSIFLSSYTTCLISLTISCV